MMKYSFVFCLFRFYFVEFDVDDKESPIEIVKVVEPVRLQVKSPSFETFASAVKDSPYFDDQWIKDL